MSGSLSCVNAVTVNDIGLVFRACAGQDALGSSPYMETHVSVITLDLRGSKMCWVSIVICVIGHQSMTRFCTLASASNLERNKLYDEFVAWLAL